MKKLTVLLASAVLLALTGCAGFEPLYGENTAVRRSFDSLSLAPVEGRAGFLFIQSMAERGGVTIGQSGAYVLETVISKSQTNVGVRVDDVSTRARLTLIAQYSVRGKNGKIAYSGQAQSSAAFDEPDQPYGALIAEQAAEEIAASVLAEKVLNDLAVFFANIADNTPEGS